MIQLSREGACIPIIDTKTGDVFRLSASGSEIETVSTDPRLVPSQSVGMRAEGSINLMRFKLKIKENKLQAISSSSGMSAYRSSLYNYQQTLSTSQTPTKCSLS